MTTRNYKSHTIFGTPLFELPIGQLPTNVDVVRHAIALKSTKYARNKSILPVAVENVQKIWTKANVPTMTRQSIDLLLRLLDDSAFFLDDPIINLKNLLKNFQICLI